MTWSIVLILGAMRRHQIVTRRFKHRALHSTKRFDQIDADHARRQSHSALIRRDWIRRSPSIETASPFETDFETARFCRSGERVIQKYSRRFAVIFRIRLHTKRVHQIAVHRIGLVDRGRNRMP